MKHLAYILLFFLLFTFEVSGQHLHVDWTRFIGETSCCVGLNYAIPSRDGGIVFTGFDISSDTINGDIPPAPVGGGEVIVGKIDSNHNLLWLKTYNGNRGYSICQTFDGGYAVLAHTDFGSGDITGFHPGGADIWLFRIDSIGNFLYGNCFGSDTGDEFPFSIAETKDHGFIILGASNWYGEDVPFHLGSSEFEYDWFVVKTDSMAHLQWTKDLGGSKDEWCSGPGKIIETNNGYYLLSSSFSKDYDCIDTNWHAGINTQDDIYIFKLDTGGSVIWTKSIGGTGYDEFYDGVLNLNDSSIVITGFTTSNDYIFTGMIGSIYVISINKYGNINWVKTYLGNGATSIAKVPNIGYCILGSTSIGTIGQTDNLAYIIDSMGNIITDTIFGGLNYDYTSSIFPFNSGFIATGSSGSDSFTDGRNYGRRGFGQELTISYIKEYPFPINVNNIINDNNNNLVLYPNPSNNTVNISAVNTIEHITIRNTIGQTIYTEYINTNNIEINISEWVKGLYIVQLLCADGNTITTKLIIN